MQRICVALILLFGWAPVSAQVLVNAADEWFFHKGTNAVQTGWKTLPDAELLPNAWAKGAGGLGYASDNSGEVALCKTILSDMKDRYKTVFYRRTFTAPTEVTPSLHLMLTMDFDDGFIAWLDGKYLTNVYSPGAPAEPAHDASASGTRESSRGNSSPQPAMTFDLGPVADRLAPGEHILAIVGLNTSSGSTDFIQVPRLFLEAPPVVPTNTWTGTLAANATFAAAESPYHISGTLTVPSGRTLTIEPGTAVYLLSGAKIVVASGGRILAEGTAEAPIRLTRPSSTAANWGRLEINGSTGSPETRIAHAYIEGNGTSPCINVDGGTVFLSHIEFGTATRRYLDLDYASFVISDCHFPAPVGSFEPIHGTQGIRPGGRGIIQNCFFGAHTGYNDTIDFTGGNRPGPILQVYNNVFMGTGDDNLDLDSADAWVQGNIFLHIHRNGSPDTASAVSGGNDDGNNGNVTVIGNIFYDCDQLAMAKQGNFYTILNNTVVRQTHVGGQDTEGAILCVQDNNMTEARGMYLEGNIFCGIENLTRNVTNAVVTFRNNLMPLEWSGPGEGNRTNNPMLTYIPRLEETWFTNWAQAQIMKEWFKPGPGSPALGAAVDGSDIGAVIPFGVRLSGAPNGTVDTTSATVSVGVNRTGFSIPQSDWPAGSGYTHYRWRLGGDGSWSPETPISQPIVLTNLSPGRQRLEVVGRNDGGLYQDDPVLGLNATITIAEWTVQTAPQFSSVIPADGRIVLQFKTLANQPCSLQFSDLADPASTWQTLTNIPPQAVAADIMFADPMTSGSRFYRVISASP